jgi:hypothetical protein
MKENKGEMGRKEKKKKRKITISDPSEARLFYLVNNNPDLIGFICSDLYPKFHLAN